MTFPNPKKLVRGIEYDGQNENAYNEISYMQNTMKHLLVIWILMAGMAVGAMAQRRLATPTNLIKMPAITQKTSTSHLSKKSQSDKKSVVSPHIKTDCPDTVMLGEPFYVEYQLIATNWKNCHIDTISDFRITSISHSKGYVQYKGKTLPSITWHVRLEADAVGELNIPSLEADVSGKHYRSPKIKVKVLPNPQYEKEYDYAFEWIKTHRQNDTVKYAVRLKMEYHTKCLTVFNDVSSRAFIMVAGPQYWSVLPNPVLAYSFQNHFLQGGKGTQDILDNYTKQLLKIDINGEPLPPIENPGMGCKPLLGGLQWGQNAPYNLLTPKTKDGKRSAVGCVPVAVAQILKFYSFPSQPTSNAYYKEGDGKVYSVDFHSWKPRWNEMSDHYQKEDSLNAVASVMVMVGMGLNARYGENATNANLAKVKPLMCTNFGYSSCMRWLTHLPDSALLHGLCTELDKGRPCIVSSENHAFVADGYDSEYIHCNLGWNGACNGWYRPCIQFAKTDTAQGLLRSMVSAIIPRHNIVKRELYVKKEGQLQTLLPVEELQSITHLRISGKLNGDDIKWLRIMAGAPEEGLEDPDQWGNLCHLDMENAVIVKGRKEYLAQQSDKTWTLRVDGKVSTYDLSRKLSEREWRYFRFDIGKKQMGSIFERLADGTIIEHYTTEKNTIGCYMFANCYSLQYLVLPKQLGMIKAKAFLNCVSLRFVTIPKKVHTIEAQAFSFCSSLDRVTFQNPKTMYARPNFQDCSPAFKLIK